ncbi:CHORISMATE SYNTHASE [Salix viminalis]|uniref:CHORISMATE SYNTHASE n=1 Tax=Salix viminalis TaxID=40686 RepID=A0A9Q0UGF0_SALVM|nr:CHORISMATE SYNTHASE [Salix viminalis]KAJ6729527.1 CHORISMATE SYNTHASE [Salix viminalis]KAJ6729528.1 CHORISMATE SYNTHASE [Salix viminalis]
MYLGFSKMSLQSEDQLGLNQYLETSNEPQKKLKISYAREFLLSLSELDICKKLPSGFDESLPSEFKDILQDRFRIPVSSSSQSSRRNDYSSSPPTRGDSGNFFRGTHGRWDSRSSGRSDRESDSQSDWDSDSGRRYINRSRRPWQVPEHDGLLGSGSFPKPSTYAAGPSAPKFRSNDQFQLNRNNEPYQPPRPYKAVPHLRREINDSLNDETFGSSESTSEDRAEEERKRRASFESMRKEQHKAFQENQKPEKSKDKFDFTELLEDSKDDKRLLNRTNELDKTVIQPLPTNEVDKPLYPSQAPVPRPLVPPGFSTMIAEKSTGTRSLTNPHPSEVGNELELSLLQAKGTRVLDWTSDNQDGKQSSDGMHLNLQQPGSPIARVSINKKSENILNIAPVLDISSKKTGSKTSNLSEVVIASDNCEVIDLDAEDVPGDKNVGESGSSHSTSILDKLFGSALTLNDTATGSSSFIEHHDVKADDRWSPQTSQSSKFAQWFIEEEKKPVDILSSGRPNDLLSLIGGGEKGGSQVKAINHMLPTLPFQSSELVDRHLSSNLKPVSVENNEKRSNTDKLDAIPAVLTCEDLEQSILSEITENGSTLLPPVHGWSGGDVKIEQQKAEYHASQHLLSLLQMGTGLDNTAPSANLGISIADRLQNTEVRNPSNAPPKPRDADAENIPNSGKVLTLETLFGTAFMKELQPVGTPVSSQRDSVGYSSDKASESLGLSIPVMDDGLLPPTAETVLSMSSHRSGVLASKQRQQIVSDRTVEHLIGFDPQNEVDSSHLRTELGSKIGGFDGSVGIKLPEEDSLIAGSDPLNLQNFLLARNSAKSELLRTPGTSVDIAEKLAALNSGFRDERPVVGQDSQPFLRGPYDMRESDVQFHNLHVQSSSSQHLPPQLNHPVPMFHPLDSHPANMNAQMKLAVPENIHHGSPNHQFSANMFRPPFNHPSSTLTGFDRSTHNSMLSQMHMHGNFPPAHLRSEFPRGAPLHPHPSNQVTGFMQESGPMQGFPFGQRQPNFGALGIPPQAIDDGGRRKQSSGGTPKADRDGAQVKG